MTDTTPATLASPTPQPIAIRWQKCWQTKEPLLVGQINWRAGHNKWQKSYLYLDARQQSFGVTVKRDKPKGTTAQTALITTMRKQVPSGVIKGIWQENNGNIWFALAGGGNQFWLLLEKRRPPLLSLITSDKTMLIRYGSKGTFTKRASFEGAIPSDEDAKEFFRPISHEVFAEALALSAKQAAEDEDNDSESDDARDKNSPQGLPHQEMEPDDQEGQEGPGGIAAAQKQIRNRLKRKLKTLRKSQEKQQNTLPAKEQVASLGEKAKLLQSFGYLIKPGDFQLVLEGKIYGLERDYELDIDPDKTLGQNIESTFMALKKAKRSAEVGEKFLQQTIKEIASVESDIARLAEVALADVELEELCRRYKLPKLVLEKTGHQVTYPYKEYVASTGHRILVGKGPKDNDILTKNAKSHDFWLHAAGLTGSHVVVPVDKSIKDQLPAALQKEAAILALHFSKARENFAGEVYVTKKHNVKKQKGMAPGLWKIEKSETLYISYKKPELEQLLASLKS